MSNLDIPLFPLHTVLFPDGRMVAVLRAGKQEVAVHVLDAATSLLAPRPDAP